ncbi:hypothetical protein CWATWH0402_5542 [Crocosphaera watsonii WH 0402]|uniref:Uncharacterized protein n=1 Tax=Crocosphaera watsonii WH 0402 TaxID=1284629 RepID=T2JJR2_CROWT|nr:hypothetical protein [Crocosphaera watsonii]CCQ64727.1 hypothetical protein CWATWH0402_5542 [Crocosphaera watsonii WH 0402]
MTGRWGDWEMGRLGDGEMGRLGITHLTETAGKLWKTLSEILG